MHEEAQEAFWDVDELENESFEWKKLANEVLGAQLYFLNFLLEEESAEAEDDSGFPTLKKTVESFFKEKKEKGGGMLPMVFVDEFKELSSEIFDWPSQNRVNDNLIPPEGGDGEGEAQSLRISQKEANEENSFFYEVDFDQFTGTEFREKEAGNRQEALKTQKKGKNTKKRKKQNGKKTKKQDLIKEKTIKIQEAISVLDFLEGKHGKNEFLFKAPAHLVHPKFILESKELFHSDTERLLKEEGQNWQEKQKKLKRKQEPIDDFQTVTTKGPKALAEEPKSKMLGAAKNHFQNFEQFILTEDEENPEKTKELNRQKDKTSEKAKQIDVSELSTSKSKNRSGSSNGKTNKLAKKPRNEENVSIFESKSTRKKKKTQAKKLKKSNQIPNPNDSDEKLGELAANKEIPITQHLLNEQIKSNECFEETKDATKRGVENQGANEEPKKTDDRGIEGKDDENNKEKKKRKKRKKKGKKKESENGESVPDDFIHDSSKESSDSEYFTIVNESGFVSEELKDLSFLKFFPSDFCEKAPSRAYFQSFMKEKFDPLLVPVHKKIEKLARNSGKGKIYIQGGRKICIEKKVIKTREFIFNGQLP